jgi:hypothetical protein
MMPGYAIHASWHTERWSWLDGLVWQSDRQSPTFYLLTNVQGITSAEHAVKIARDVLDPYGTWGDDLSIHAEPVSLGT